MEKSIESKLSETPASKLVKIILAALETMDEEAQSNFIAKHIDAKISLARLSSDDPEAFIEEVETFCLSCLDGDFYTSDSDVEEYFSDSYSYGSYDDDWDYDEFYRNTEWAGIFAKLLKLAMMYIQSGDIKTGYESVSRLLNCLIQLDSDDMHLGVDEPQSYIDIDWQEMFDLTYEAMFKYHSDASMATKMAFRLWKHFGSSCDEGFLTNIKDVRIARDTIVNEIKISYKWDLQEKLFELLERLYKRHDEEFDKIKLASSLTSINVNFHYMVVEGLIESGQWNEAVVAARIALEKIAPPDDSMNYFLSCIYEELRAGVWTNLTNAYEQLEEYENAYDAAKRMFEEMPSYAQYKRARALSVKIDKYFEFFSFACDFLGRVDDAQAYKLRNILLEIYSYEGKTHELLELAKLHEIDRNYSDKKYIALSLIFRATRDASGLGSSLTEYLTGAAGQDGIEDMLLFESDNLTRQELLLSGVDLLK